MARTDGRALSLIRTMPPPCEMLRGELNALNPLHGSGPLMGEKTPFQRDISETRQNCSAFRYQGIDTNWSDC